MPTTLPRTQLTHTPEVQRALKIAARRWPGEKPSTLMQRLLEEGARAVEVDLAEQREERRVRIDEAFEELTELELRYPPDYLKRLREEWEE
ncbi:hypothetical protein [Leucobacter massiliensis]|uniref:Uncharacterized protein n=1 Tax=Leucobacter massiliensis TaxID=1686285 RepID=A0A2S9QK90_9MICO|nr:hypothetical protein [Leucobacter massiliensis]PRI10004.1 hypothetical protein B4915_13850 [Leucobacter massiliensis]